MNKRSKRIIAAISAIAITVSITATNTINVFAGTLAEGASEIAYDVAAEGMVLMENEENTLPLDKGTSVALFGRSSVDTIKGGTGSANVKSPYIINIYEAIQEKDDLVIQEDLLDAYLDFSQEVGLTPVAGVGGGGSPSEMELNPSDELMEKASEADVAILTIGRNSGEGTDRVLHPNPYTYSGKTFTPGDYYLSADEEALLEKVDEYFDEIIVLLNIGGVMDLTWVEEYDSIKSVMLVWQPGMEGSYAVADALTGVINPSGKLTDTFARNFEDYPSSETFLNTNPVFTEDIYVGYRYFETFNKEAVQYPFGYGLSYTEFTYEDIVVDTSNVNVSGSIRDNFSIDGTIDVSVTVKNVGYAAGKEAVQVYFNAPDGKLATPDRQLVAYAKTDELQPGQEQTLTMSFDAADMAAYDDSNATGYESCYVMEAGEYEIYVGKNVRETTKEGSYNLTGTSNGLPVVVEELTEYLAPKSSFEILTKAEDGSETTMEVAVGSNEVEVYTEDAWVFDADAVTEVKDSYTLGDVYNGVLTMENFVASLPDNMLVYLVSGGTNNTGGGPSNEAPGGAAGMFGGASDYGIPGVVVADGPSGIVLSATAEAPGNTAFPIATMVACTWNLDLIEVYGAIIGTEAAQDGVDMWLAPGMNIHRNPLGARNFEYYSEDPLVTGLTAAATTRGVQSKGVAVTIKHFALNNQETDRSRGNSIASERAIREIYLKGFEIAVKDGKAWGAMSSYNLINGSKASSNHQLLTDILRGEWGFDGLVMTDWGGAGDNGAPSQIAAQNDLLMPRGSVTVAQIDAGVMTRWQLQRSVYNVVNAAYRSLSFRNSIGAEAYVPDTSEPLVNTSKGDVENWFDFASDANRQILADTIADAEALVGTEEYNNSYDFIQKNLDNTIAAAKAMAEELYVSNADAVTAIYDLIDAMRYLGNNPANASILEAYVGIVEGIDLTKYTIGVEAVQEKLAAAKAVLADVAAGEIVLQDEVDQAYNELRTAVAGLRSVVNKDMLIALRDKVANTDLSKFTEESAAIFSVAFANATAIINDDDATEDDVENAYIILLNAIDGLTPLSDGNGDTDDTDDTNDTNDTGDIDDTNSTGDTSDTDDTNSTDDTSDTNDTNNTNSTDDTSDTNGGSGSSKTNGTSSTGKTTAGTGKSPKTGDNNIAALFAVMFAMGGAATIILLKKRTAK